MIPIGIVVALAIICVVAAVLTAADRADDVELQQERLLLTNAIADRGHRVLRELENIAASHDVVYQLHYNFDRDWVHHLVGLRLNTFFDHDHVFVADGADRLTYALQGDASVDPDLFGPAKSELNRVVELLRGRALPNLDEYHQEPAIDPKTKLGHPRGVQRLQLFMKRPAIVAGVVAELPSLAGPISGGHPPLLMTVKFLDGQLLSDIGVRFDLPRLRALGSDPVRNDEHVYVVADSAGAAIARFAWAPNQPGTSIVSTVLPFMAIAFGGFALLTALALRYIRRSAAKIAEGENRLRHLALHDPLSGLPNRTYFGERLGAVIGGTGKSDGIAAVLAIDLDHFKDINDTLGHHIGDGLIGVVAQRLVHAVRHEDLVARLGGDEFAVITTEAADLQMLQRFAERLIAVLRAPYSISGHTLLIGASIGIAVIDRRTGDGADIMRRADVALYRAKNEGRSRACIYDADMDADLRERKQLENDLRTAIAEDRLSVAYQPIMNASGEKMAGVEALCRWSHPTRGNVPPSDFIPIAERSELIIPLGEWVLRQACIEAKRWTGLTVAVNVSPLQFRRQDFVEMVERILAETEFDPNRLELELTESTLLGNVEEAEKAMHRLKAQGVRFALDDFGTGYSSLLYLRSFPFDRIKIDRSFVRSIESAADAASIVHAIVSLGRGLGMKVTAEGVETAEQQLFLRAAGVHSMQGFRFGKPSPAAVISERLHPAAAAPQAAAG
ncbi:MAG: EAL domain-containing protein [Alphaproteobacteria bacterium]|nr:MAG: EAL domain-containing protein [Alphaproteobacteria bacterium]